MDEFALIDTIVAAFGDAARGERVVLGPGDDGAVVALPAGHALVSSIDAYTADVHFPRAAPPALIGYRVLGAATSDLAAMGAAPSHALAALSVEEAEPGWLEDLARGMAAAARDFALPLAGGNLCRGPLTLSVSVHGSVPDGAALRRHGARAGDLVCLSGEIGGAGAALADPRLSAPDTIEALRQRPGGEAARRRRYYLPVPRLALGQALRGLASAAIDVSDGLISDLGHICRASGVGAVLDPDAVPLAAGCALPAALRSGDDYELCFTVPAGRARELAALPDPVTVIGRIREGTGVAVGGAPEDRIEDAGGYRHF